MSDDKVRCVIGVIGLLLVGCASTPSRGIIPTTGVPFAAGILPHSTADPEAQQDAVIETAWAAYWAAQTQTTQAQPTRTPEAEGQSLSRPAQTATPLSTSALTDTSSSTLSAQGVLYKITPVEGNPASDKTR